MVELDEENISCDSSTSLSHPLSRLWSIYYVFFFKIYVFNFSLSTWCYLLWIIYFL